MIPINEVEIVVKSNDRTGFTALAAKIRTAMNSTVRDGVNDVDKTVTSRFKEIGDKGGRAMSTGLGQAVQGTEKVELAARKMGLAVQDAADRAARAERDAGQAADRLRDAEEEAAAAKKAAAEAAAKLERGEISEAEATRLAADAAKKATVAEREKERATDAAARASRSAERADLAEATAAEALAVAVSKAAERHRKLVEDSKRSFGDIVRESSKAAKGVEGGFSQAFREMGAQWKIVAIANAIAMLPTIASVAGGGISLALGGAFAAVGLIVQAKSADIKNAFSDLRKHVSSELKDMTAPFHDTLGHMIDDARRAFDSLDLAKPFAAIAPAVTKFSAQFASSLSRLNPLFASIGTAFSRTLGALGPRMDAIMNNLATGIKGITDAVAHNPAAFADFAEGISKVVRYTGDGIGFLIRFKDELYGFTQVMGGGGVLGLFKFIDGLVRLKNVIGRHLFGDSGKSLSDLGVSAGDAGSAMVKTGMATQKLLTEQKAATLTSDQLKAALDRLTGANQSAFDAQTQYQEALRNAAGLAKHNNAGIDGNSEAVNRNREALSQLGTAIKNNITGKTPAQIDAMRDKFVHMAEGMGVPKREAKELANQLLGIRDNSEKIPKSTTTHLKAKDDTKPATASAQHNLKNIKKTYRAVLSAVDKTLGAVDSARKKVRAFARALYRAQLTATNKVGGAVASAARACLGFARRTYRAQLTAINRAGAALAAALRAGRSWAGRVFTATFNVIRSIIPGHAAGGIIGGGYAHGGVFGGIGRAAAGGPRSNLTLVGEAGAELVRLPTGSTVIPHGQSMNTLAGMGGGGAMRVELEWVGGNAGDKFMVWLKENIRVRVGSGPDSVQRALGG